MKPRARIAAAAVVGVAGLSVGGCFGRPDYGPIGLNGSPYGYTDEAIAGGRSIRVILPAHTEDPQIAYAYWNRRAEEICDGAILRKQIHTARQYVGMHYSRMNGLVGDYLLEGYVWCETPSGAPPEPATPASSPAGS